MLSENWTFLEIFMAVGIRRKQNKYLTVQENIVIRKAFYVDLKHCLKAKL